MLSRPTRSSKYFCLSGAKLPVTVITRSRIFLLIKGFIMPIMILNQRAPPNRNTPFIFTGTVPIVNRSILAPKSMGTRVMLLQNPILLRSCNIKTPLSCAFLSNITKWMYQTMYLRLSCAEMVLIFFLSSFEMSSHQIKWPSVATDPSMPHTLEVSLTDSYVRGCSARSAAMLSFIQSKYMSNRRRALEALTTRFASSLPSTMSSLSLMAHFRKAFRKFVWLVWNSSRGTRSIHESNGSFILACSCSSASLVSFSFR
mmetsp:Transcript_17672/g.38611  ORF Transcript_17672/g.38611 Transcript_17672/m.38611 type:complete len:257 (-) Transcript_17672:374-1144(-)